MKLLQLVGAALLTASVASAGDRDKPFKLMVGDPAPDIEVREWVQGEPVTAFESGQVYVVEFWATWCGPCRKAIPHMSELAREYGDQVRFIGVSVWERISEDAPYAVPAFVEKMGEKMIYTVASDRTAEGQKGVMVKAWMHAAGQRSIPTAFIVDGTGRIAWIGNPLGDFDEALAMIVAGEWDIEAEASEYAASMAVEAAYDKVQAARSDARKSGDWGAALAVLDGVLREHPSLEQKLAGERYVLLNAAGKRADAAKYGRKIVGDFYAGNAARLNAFAWTIVDPGTREENADVELAKLAGKRANELTEWRDPAVLDTYALALFLLGEHTRAIEVQEEAVRFSIGTTYEGELKARLAEYREKVGTQS